MKFVVIDDDPTGSQTVHDCLLLLKWDCSTLVKGFESKSNLFFILANTRSLSENDAKLTIEEICKNLKTVITSQAYEEEIIFISRGDSTLRGHNYLEPTTLNSCLGPFDATFHIPAFIEGKRLTINGSHFVDKTPISKTIFATDKIFGYETSNVKNLLFQQSKSQINFEDIQNLLLSDIEMLNDEENNIVFKTLKNLKNNKHVIVDIENYSQLKKFSLVIKKLINELSDSPYRSARFISCMVLCDPSGNLVKDTTGICWGEILKKPKYPKGEFESIFWVKEANCVYGELSQSQLSKLGSRGKAAKIISPFLKKEIGLN